jgi:hypothetical protein
VDTTATVTTNTNVLLKQAFGSSLIGNTNATATTNQLTYLAQLFRSTSEVMAPIHTADVVTNGQASIVSCTNSTGSINVTTAGGSSTWTAGDPIVFFNSVTDTTKAGTELNLWPSRPPGRDAVLVAPRPRHLDGGELGQLHGYLGRPVRLHQAPEGPAVHQQLRRHGAGHAHPVQRRAERRHGGGAGGPDLPRRVDVRPGRQPQGEGDRDPHVLLAPPGIAFLYDSDAYTKLELGDLPSEDGGPDLFDIDKLPNQNLWAASLNYAYLRACTNRAAISAATAA